MRVLTRSLRNPVTRRRRQRNAWINYVANITATRSRKGIRPPRLNKYGIFFFFFAFDHIAPLSLSLTTLWSSGFKNDQVWTPFFLFGQIHTDSHSSFSFAWFLDPLSLPPHSFRNVAGRSNNLSRLGKQGSSILLEKTGKWSRGISGSRWSI